MGQATTLDQNIACLVIGVLILDQDIEDSTGIRNGDLGFLGVGGLDDVVLRKRSRQDAPVPKRSRHCRENKKVTLVGNFSTGRGQ